MQSEPRWTYEPNPIKNTSKMSTKQKIELQKMSYSKNERELQEKIDARLLKSVNTVPIPASPEGPVAYLTCGHGSEIIVVDSGSDAGELLYTIEGHDFKPVLIHLTHAHMGHIAALPELLERDPAPVMMHINDKELFEQNMPGVKMDRFIHERGKIDGTPYDIEAIPTPGHTKDSTCYLIDSGLYTGDTLLNGSIGRKDLPASSWPAMSRSLRILKKLDAVTPVFPGHGEPSNLRDECRNNGWLR